MSEVTPPPEAQETKSKEEEKHPVKDSFKRRARDLVLVAAGAAAAVGGGALQPPAVPAPERPTPPPAGQVPETAKAEVQKVNLSLREIFSQPIRGIEERLSQQVGKEITFQVDTPFILNSEGQYVKLPDGKEYFSVRFAYSPFAPDATDLRIRKPYPPLIMRPKDFIDFQADKWGLKEGTTPGFVDLPQGATITVEVTPLFNNPAVPQLIFKGIAFPGSENPAAPAETPTE